jgi:hypothetical protein
MHNTSALTVPLRRLYANVTLLGAHIASVVARALQEAVFLRWDVQH